MIYAIIFALIVICQVIILVLRRNELVAGERNLKAIFLYNRNDSRFENISFIALGVALFLMASLRDGIGYDWDNYLHRFHAFDHLAGLNLSIFTKIGLLGLEPGYAFLSIVMPSFHLLIFVIATFSVLTKLWIINKYSEAKFISLLMYFAGIFIAYDMGIIRQAVSISMLLIGLQFIKERKLIKFLIAVLFGSLFHITTLIFIPLYFIHFRHFSRIKIYVVAAVSMVFYFIDFTRMLMFTLELLRLDILTERLLVYVDYDSDLLLSLIKRIVVLIVFVEFFERFKIEDKISRICLNGYIISIILMALFSSIPNLGARGVIGLYFLQIFIFAKIFAVSNKLYLKLGILAVIIALSIETMVSIILEGNATGQPYTPFRSLLWR